MTRSKKNIINVQDVLMTTPSYPAYGGRDEAGNELTIERYKIELLFEDGRKYAHPEMGDERFIKNLEDRIRRHGTINLEHWHMIRDVQDYSQK